MIITNNDTWYLNAKNLSNINEELDWDSMLSNETNGGKSFIHYPNIPSGYPSVDIELEEFGTFQLPKNLNSGDNSTAKRYPITFLKDHNYILCIPSYEYTTKSGVHVTKVRTKLVLKNTTEVIIDEIKDIELNDGFYRFYNLEKDIYYILKNSNEWIDTSKLKSFGEESFYSLDYLKANSLYNYNIGEHCNIWFELTVEYYFYNVLLDTYKCVFNPYIFDVILNYNNMSLIAETNYHGYGVELIPLYYDIWADNLDELLYKVDSYPTRTVNSPLKTAYKNDISLNVVRSGITEKTNESLLQITPEEIISKSKDKKFTNVDYLYQSKVEAEEPIDIKYQLTVNPENYMFAVWAPKSANQILDDFGQNGAVEMTLFPNYEDITTTLSFVGKYAAGIIGEANDLATYTFGELSDSLTLRLEFNNISEFKRENLQKTPIGKMLILSANCDSNIGYNYVSANDTVKSVTKGINLFSNITPLKSIKSVETLTCNVDYKVPFSAYNTSDYEVVAQLNDICTIDGVDYLGYMDDTLGILRSNIDISYNYLLYNGRSERRLLFNQGVDYTVKHYEGTSLYHQGLVYYHFEKETKVEIDLPSGLYYFNANVQTATTKVMVESTKTNQCVINIANPRSVAIIVPQGADIASIGLYKVNTSYGTETLLENCNILNNGKFSINENVFDYVYPQTVYTYCENKIQCDDKTYNYTGYPQHGYLILKDSYKLNAGSYDTARISQHNVDIIIRE